MVATCDIQAEERPILIAPFLELEPAVRGRNVEQIAEDGSPWRTFGEL